MDGFEFNVNEKIKMKFGIVGGSSPQPEPGGGAAVLTGTPILIVNRASFGDEPLYGTPILVEE